jgi:hypothetical protein
MREEEIKKSLKSPPVVGLAIGFGVGVVSALMFLLMGADAGDYHFAFSILDELMDCVLEYLDRALGLDNDIFVTVVLLIWYAQYGLYGGILYWFLRKKLERSIAFLVLASFFLTLFVLIYWMNGYFSRWF